MATSYIERELKFDVGLDFVVPDLVGLLPAGGSTHTSTEHLRSEYFDTADRALLQARMTLRRRTGSTDAGWQLKVPFAGFREEIRVDDADGTDVPEELLQLLVGVGRGQSLAPIASVVTERSVTTLIDGDGRKLAEIDDDTVHAAATGEAALASSWREVEVELGEDEVELLYALGKRLRRAGATSSASTSKLARALPAAPLARRKGKPRAADVIGAYLLEQQHAVLAGDLALRRGDDTVIHKTRVATRRFRSALRVFGALFDEQQAATLDDELRWFAALLGGVRDAQVLRSRLDTMLQQVDDSLLLGPVRARVDTELRREQGEHWQMLQEELNGPRYLAVLEVLHHWVVATPWTPRAAKPAARIAPLVKRAERQVTRRLKRANATGDIHLLHGARKAAKRARYASEAAAPVIGKRAASELTTRYQRLQDLLGEHQDSLVSADLLRRLGAKAGTTKGENGFAFGILHEREDRSAQLARDKAVRTAKRFS
jgi:CHAD domain-containing protein